MLIEILSNPLVQNALLALILMSVASGFIGTYIHIRKISSISGGISHAVLGGLGIAVFYNIDPMTGALVAAVVVALLIGMIQLRFHEHQDTIINAVWAIGMAIGIIFLYFSPQYQQNLVNYLFGKIFYISQWNLIMMLIIDFAVIVVFFVFYRQIFAISFDEEYSVIRGLPSRFIYLLLLVLIALTVVVMVQAVGLILIIALLTLPVAIARSMSDCPPWIIVNTIVITLVLGITGLLLSFPLQIPTAPLIIITFGVAYILSLIVNKVGKSLFK